jgi:hypothetical protein
MEELQQYTKLLCEKKAIWRLDDHHIVMRRYRKSQVLHISFLVNTFIHKNQLILTSISNLVEMQPLAMALTYLVPNSWILRHASAVSSYTYTYISN